MNRRFFTALDRCDEWAHRHGMGTANGASFPLWWRLTPFPLLCDLRDWLYGYREGNPMKKRLASALRRAADRLDPQPALADWPDVWVPPATSSGTAAFGSTITITGATINRRPL